MKKLFVIHLLVLLMLKQSIVAQNIGIGTTNPAARLHVADSAVVFSALGSPPVVSGKTAIEGAGRRMMWHPDKAAFRTGYVYGGAWDDNNIGRYSFAAGLEVWASGAGSIALGTSNYAQGMGGIAIGTNCNAKGNYSVAIGRDAFSPGGNGIAIGNGATASGNSSLALGTYVSTSNLDGAFALGDNSTTITMQSFAANGFRARFAGGYRLFTNSAVTIGAFLNSGANSWAALSDVRMKENFLPVNGEVFLQKIAAMPQFTWNYIGQDVATFRHYGPMAQDFYQAFGRDGLGEIGCDTLINQQDFLGVNFIAIQALEKRSTELATENSLLKSKVLLLEDANKQLAEKLVSLSENIDAELKLVKAQLANKTVTTNKVDD